MFDFFIHISKKHHPAQIRFDAVSKEIYLKNISYREELFEDVHFRLSALVHEDLGDSYHFSSKEISVFTMGNAYTTNAYAESLNSKPQPVEPSFIFDMYNEQGSSFINNLKGIFIILVLDEANSRFQLFSSRNGLYDAYYIEGDDYLIASSSLEAIVKFPGITPEIDPVALIQHSIFDYPLGEKTLFSNVSILPPSTCLTYNLKSASQFKYFDYLPLLKRKDPLTWKETYARTPARFNDAVDLLTAGKEKLCASLTSGFDSRTNLSRLYNTGKDILYYSWGMPGSIEIQIPQLIAKKTGIRYEPVLLEKEFEDAYNYFGKQAVMWSGGKGTIRRANHTYGYSRLVNQSHTVITGLFGSELLRPANAVGHIFNQAFIDVLYADDQALKLSELYETEQAKCFLQHKMLEENKTDFIKRTSEYFTGLNEVGEKYLQLYYFSLTEGFRKYFGHEIHGCREYVQILSPYIDDDFVEFILSTPVPDLNKVAFKRNPKSLRLGQAFYLPVLRANFKQLMKIPTGRFYSPSQLGSVFYPLSILPAYIKHRRRQKVNDTFNNKKWNQAFMENNNHLATYKDHFLTRMDHVKANSDIDIAKHLSLRFWLSGLGSF